MSQHSAAGRDKLKVAFESIFVGHERIFPLEETPLSEDPKHQCEESDEAGV